MENKPIKRKNLVPINEEHFFRMTEKCAKEDIKHNYMYKDEGKLLEHNTKFLHIRKDDNNKHYISALKIEKYTLTDNIKDFPLYLVSLSGLLLALLSLLLLPNNIETFMGIITFSGMIFFSGLGLISDRSEYIFNNARKRYRCIEYRLCEISNINDLHKALTDTDTAIPALEIITALTRYKKSLDKNDYNCKTIRELENKISDLTDNAQINYKNSPDLIQEKLMKEHNLKMLEIENKKYKESIEDEVQVSLNVADDLLIKYQ